MIGRNASAPRIPTNIIPASTRECPSPTNRISELFRWSWHAPRNKGTATMKRTISSALACLAACVLLTAALTSTIRAQAPEKKEGYSESFRGSQRSNETFQKIAPFKLFDNLYYVGPGFVSVWLVPTSAGLILIDTAQEPYVDHVVDSIRKSGFDPKDIKYIVLSHGHLDHFGGAARIQELSGA